MRLSLDKHTRYQIAAGLILLSAALLRVWDLGLKPPHFDEGINGGFADKMLMEGGYRYDPDNFHGPLYFYLLLLFETLFGRTITVLRLPTVLAGIGVVAIALWGFRRHLGDHAALWFGGFLAVSPALVFVSRYAIHEMYQLLFLMVFTLGLLDIRETRRGVWLVCAGVAGMILTKETYVLHLACAGLAWLVWKGLRRIVPDSPSSTPSMSPDHGWRDCSPAVAAAIGAVLFFYSAGLTHPEGVTGLWKTFATWTQTGLQEGGHAKPWHYWLRLMARYEWIALAGFAAAATFLWTGKKGIRITVIAGCGTLAAYSLISYKTPWCIVAFLPAGALVLACLLSRAADCQTRLRTAAPLAALLLGGHDLWMTLRLNWRDYDDSNEPYVYVQTYREIYRFVAPLESARVSNPLLAHRPGVIVVDAPFPLPWMLRQYPLIRYVDAEVPADKAVTLADFVLVQESRRAEVEDLLYGEFWMVELRLRSGHENMTAYFRSRVFGESVFGDPGRLMAFGGRNAPGGKEISR